MQDSSTALTAVLQFRQDLQAKLRDGVRRAIETVLEEELLASGGGGELEAIDVEIEYRSPAQPGVMRVLRDGARRWIVNSEEEIHASLIIASLNRE